MAGLVDPGCVEMLSRLQRSPFWMPDPKAWQWKRPDGVLQGFAGLADNDPGLANLLWLSMDMGTAPSVYDASQNPLYKAVMMQVNSSEMLGEPINHWAALSTLEQFVHLLQQHACLKPSPAKMPNALERAYPLLRVLALRRIQHAHP